MVRFRTVTVVRRLLILGIAGLAVLARPAAAQTKPAQIYVEGGPKHEGGSA
jgi:hypothetical protein